MLVPLNSAYSWTSTFVCFVSVNEMWRGGLVAFWLSCGGVLVYCLEGCFGMMDISWVCCMHELMCKVWLMYICGGDDRLAWLLNEYEASGVARESFSQCIRWNISFHPPSFNLDLMGEVHVINHHIQVCITLYYPEYEQWIRPNEVTLKLPGSKPKWIQ